MRTSATKVRGSSHSANSAEQTNTGRDYLHDVIHECAVTVSVFVYFQAVELRVMLHPRLRRLRERAKKGVM
jgi:hypothetical protein